jgi:hypothetical protein
MPTVAAMAVIVSQEQHQPRTSGKPSTYVGRLLPRQQRLPWGGVRRIIRELKIWL